MCFLILMCYGFFILSSYASVIEIVLLLFLLLFVVYFCFTIVFVAVLLLQKKVFSRYL